MSEIVIREASEKDIEDIARLVTRLKRLNEEFDPLLKIVDNIEEVCRKYVEESVKSKDSLVLVVEHKGRIVGVLKAAFKKRIFYEPPIEGQIQEFYILPEFRRRGYGKKLFEEALKRLQGRVSFITVSFPSLNKIGTAFYEKFNFRPIYNVYAREAD